MKDYQLFLQVIKNQKRQHSLGYDNLKPVIDIEKHNIVIKFETSEVGFTFCKKTGRLRGIFNWKE